MPNLTVNNHPLSVENDCNLSQLIIVAGYAEQTIAVAINGEFIPKAQYSHTDLATGDCVDIVKPIGGG
ncbi:MAG: sulfur carrier protein ThiS [Oceanospirillaceae bacterium]|nr:sulfur carrier protein ThiS [Oceanospirillaceae bacterium]